MRLKWGMFPHYSVFCFILHFNRYFKLLLHCQCQQKPCVGTSTVWDCLLILDLLSFYIALWLVQLCCGMMPHVHLFHLSHKSRLRNFRFGENVLCNACN